MPENKRKYKRLGQHLTIQYCLADVYPKEWDITFIENISVGGVKFIASSNFELNDRIIQLRIRVPELAPGYLKFEAIVLSAKQRFNGKTCEIRAKFRDLTEEDKKSLSVLEKLIDLQENRNSQKKIGR